MAESPASLLPGPDNRFVGREAELDEVRALIGPHRLVTLVGPGGCGKTRLAIEVARARPGVAFVDLSAVRDPDAVRSLIDGVLDQAEDAPRLVVLDNCEQVIAPAREQVARLLGSGPQLGVLATSREALSLAQEHVWQVPPLSPSESVELFVDRAALGSRAFRLTRSNTDDVTQIARAFEGLPLGIELAAAWTPVIGVAGILDRMASRLDLFISSPHATAPRHQSLRAAIEWSNELLEPRERKFWWRLGIFAPLFDLAAAEAVCADVDIPKTEIPHLMRRLVERSLVQAQGDGSSFGYRLLDTVRDFCIAQLDSEGDLTRLSEAHARYYVSLAEEAFTHRDQSDLAAWAERMTAAHGNVRAALGWLREHDPEAAVQLSGAMGWVWGARALLPEGRRLLQESLSRSDSGSWFAARAHRASGLLALDQGDETAARAHLSSALRFYEDSGDEAGAAIVLARLGMLTGARETLERAAELAERTGERTALVISLANLAALDLRRGAARSARLRYEQAVAVCREMGHVRWLPTTLEGLAQAQLAEGDARAARRVAAEAISLADTYRLSAMLPSMLETMAAVASASSSPERALRLAGAAEGLRKLGVAAPHDWPARLEAALALARREVRGAADALLAEGAEMPQASAVALALSEKDASLPAPGMAISRRQAQVAALVAAGLTNAQIAARLHIAERTAEWHVEELRNRLGFSSRAQVAAWAARQGLDRP